MQSNPNPGPAAGEPPVPASVEAVTTEWLAAVLGTKLGGPVVASEILRVIHGTATKIHVAVDVRRNGTVERQTIWAKTGLEPHSLSDGQEAVGAGEVYFYRNLADRYGFELPRCYYAHVEPDTGRFIMLLFDLLDIGAHFWEPTDHASVEQVAAGLDRIAHYQARSWQDPFLLADAYLVGGGALRRGRIDDYLFSPENWDEQTARPRFRTPGLPLIERALWQRAHRTLLDKWWPVGPLCLSHGDCHVGQAWHTPDGKVRMLDWQCVMAASWLHDVANFIVSALPIADRRSAEGDLVRAHMERLRALGVPDVPDIDAAWNGYRAGALYGATWLLCRVEWQSEENCTIVGERHMTAVADLQSVEVILTRAD